MSPHISDLNGLGEDPDTMRGELTALLGLEQIERTIIDIQIFGQGPEAIVEMTLSGDLTIHFERLAHLTKPSLLSAYLAGTGVSRTFKASEAVTACALSARLGRHHESERVGLAAREWGADFLRAAGAERVDLADQADRWRAFQMLASIDPFQAAGERASPLQLAAASLVLEDTSSHARLVRAGWFMAYVRREAGTFAPHHLAMEMARAGWQRTGGEGLIKATAPTDGRTLSWRFYTVPEGW